jgi:formyl-CoA transferase
MNPDNTHTQSVSGPSLDGVRVLDLTHFEAGTSTTQTLAWLGADVIKVEPPNGGEQGRRASADDPDTDSWYFILLNSNKRSIVLNLRDEDDKDRLRELIAISDVFVENYAPGTIERLGFGYDEVRAINPRMIYASIKGYPEESPYAEYLSFDPIGQSVGGALSITGEAGQRPVKPGPTLADTGTGLHAVIGILAALHQRERTGEGQRVRVSMQEAIINYCRIAYVEQLRRGEPATRHGNHSPMSTHPSDTYRCAGGGPNDFCFIYTSRANNVQWERLLDVVGRPELKSDPRLASPEKRMNWAQEITEIVEAWSTTLHKLDVMRLLGEAGVPAGAVLDTEELSTDPALRKSGMFVELDHAARGHYVMPGSPIRMSASAVPITPAPLLGEHTTEVLQLLGIDSR